MSLPSAGRTAFDIAVIIPLREELTEFLDIFPFKSDYSTSEDFRCEVETGVADLSMIVIRQRNMGRREAYASAENILKEFDIGLIVCIGIAGALSKDLALTDVCCAESIIDVYENAKISTKKSKVTHTFSPITYDTPRSYIAAFEYNHSIPELRKRYIEWQLQRKAVAEDALQDKVAGRSGDETIGAPNSLSGPLVCASVTESPDYNAALRAIDRKILAVETEAGGVFDIASKMSVPAVQIRGISDYADIGKTKLEGATKGKVRALAAANAVTFFQLQLQNAFFLKLIAQRRAERLQGPAAFGTFSPAVVPIALTIEYISTIIDSKLRELSPQYRNQVKGYRLPVPRIKRVRQVSEGTVEAPPEVEVLDTIPIWRSIFITIPDTFPDKSLAWVIADELITRNMSGAQYLPIVIDGSSFIHQTGKDLLASSGYDIKEFGDRNNFQIVYIVDGLPWGSSAKMNYLKDVTLGEIDARFIFVGRNTYEPVGQDEFVRLTNTHLYQVVATSFSEISHFVQRNFSTSSSEAEIIALRMHRTFKRYRLFAHPTYFAGIQRDALMLLLQADRRAELIQLAVDGYLALIVASENSEIALGRNTRIRFLRNIAFEMHVNGVQFSRQKAVAFTEQFMDQNDFGIDPLTFIQSFVAHGILGFHQDKYIFSLSFVEAYVLALELVARPSDAVVYFNNLDGDCKRLAFDLYSELGPCSKIVEDVQENMDLCISSFALSSSESNILLTNEVNPALAGKYMRLKALRKRLDSLSNDVETGAENRASKQREIDLAEEVRRATGKRAPTYKPVASITTDDARAKDLAFSIESWHAAVILLGSGAEHLSGSIKQALASSLVSLGAIIIHHWTKMVASFDLGALKEELFNSNEVKEMLEKITKEGGNRNEAKEWIKGVVDVIEFSFVGFPFHYITSKLCEQARAIVLSNSIEKIVLSEKFARLLGGVWLTDVNSAKGLPRLEEALAELPPLTFLRTSLASHFVMRIYWSIGGAGDRLRLLEAAEETLKPIASGGLDKGMLQREISKMTALEQEEEDRVK